MELRGYNFGRLNAALGQDDFEVRYSARGLDEGLTAIGCNRQGSGGSSNTVIRCA